MILFRKKLIYLDKVFFINKLKKFLKYFLNFFGLDIVQLQSIQNDLQIIFKNEINKNIKIKILDIGAFTGNSIYEFREIFINSSIYSLEPSIYNFELLKKNTANLKDVKIFNIAASNKNGFATFYHNSWEYTSSLLKLNNSEYKKKIENKFKYRGQNNTTNSFNVKVNSLDSFIEENNIKSIDILKIDTQGNEIKVLQGMSKILNFKLAKVIIIEMIFEEYYKNSEITFYNIEKYLHMNDYKIFGIYNINKTKGNRLSQIDVMYTLK